MWSAREEGGEVKEQGLEEIGGKKERQARRDGQGGLPIHAQSQNPQIISVHCHKF